MNSIKEMLKAEILRTNKLITTGTRSLQDAPKGYLTVRNRKSGQSYYWTYYEGHGKARQQKQVNISNNPEFILRLTNKMINTIILANCQHNLPFLVQLLEEYQSISADEIIADCARKYEDVMNRRKEQQIERWLAAPYEKAPFNPDRHVHETDCGELVRSKSEQILANTLFALNIPFHYEERFHYSTGNIGRVFPDFTIMLPDGRFLYWEHLGLLSNQDYCYHNADKLHIYQLNGLVISKDLILTMDDNKGSFSSALINQNIRERILPYFADIHIAKNSIIAGTRRQITN